MYIAIEHNKDGSINDAGTVEETPEKAWNKVQDVFHAPDTIIYKCIPTFTIKKEKVEFLPIK